MDHKDDAKRWSIPTTDLGIEIPDVLTFPDGSKIDFSTPSGAYDIIFSTEHPSGGDRWVMKISPQGIKFNREEWTSLSEEDFAELVMDILEKNFNVEFTKCVDIDTKMEERNPRLNLLAAMQLAAEAQGEDWPDAAKDLARRFQELLGKIYPSDFRGKDHWRPINELYDDTEARPCLLWDGHEITPYGPGIDEAIMLRDLNPRYINPHHANRGRSRESWFAQNETCGEPDGDYSYWPKFEPTHWFSWPEPPKN